MKQKAMDVKLVVRPIMGWLTHSHFWEGPCRAGRAEDMTPEAEKRAADNALAAVKRQLESVTDEIEFLDLICRLCTIADIHVCAAGNRPAVYGIVFQFIILGIKPK